MKTTLPKIALIATGLFAAQLVCAQASAPAATSVTSDDATGQKGNIFKTLDALKTKGAGRCSIGKGSECAGRRSVRSAVNDERAVDAAGTAG
jgi:hypothetical protein